MKGCTIKIAFPILLIRGIGSCIAKTATVGQYAAKETYKLLPLWSKPFGIEVFTTLVTVKLVDPRTGRFVRKAHVSQLNRFFQPQYS